MDFNNKAHGGIRLFGDTQLWITDTIVSTWIIGAVLILFAVIVRIKLKNFKEKPTGFQNVVELIVESMNNFVVSTMSPKYEKFGNWFFGAFAFILFANLSGLFGLRPPTADLATTLAFSLTTFIMVHFTGIRTLKKDYFGGYVSPYKLMLPLNIMGEAAPLISLSFRLFGNVLGGVIIMGLLYGLFPWFLKLGLPAVLHIYFDVFAGCLQSYIFVILSMTFIRAKTPD